MGFQKLVNLQPAPAVAGDFASANPRATMLAGPGALVAAALGVIVGQFAWAAAGAAQNGFQAGGAVGFVHRAQQALITNFLAEGSNVIPAGFPVTLFRAGDFFAKFAAGATIGQKVAAMYADGSCVSAVTGVMPTVAATISTATSTLITVTAVTGTPLAVGQPISGAGIPAGAYISALGTGTGGLGTYTISAAATATASGVAATVTTAFETPFYVDSTAANGELAKISTWG